ncbi:N-acetyltransferase [Bifidobacterium sp. ESL0790]|uniref:N-acetyltransferase n=1 Tax=Bifidobacterium sp. ESL0790 TaxID=2983233 RepID=UPI0023FA4646|nr:N-acetyltransferase [Bifidobacterium sp. ESL0790]WEV71926.1 N-acetyltransferase [Bifidobacterium sp. ESL0790]
MVNEQSAQRVRKANKEDLATIQSIFARARKLMAANGNLTQWGTTWPPIELIEEDIDKRRAMVLVDNDGDDGAERILAYFAVCEGEEPTYAEIDGRWLDDDAYVTVHRLASSGLRDHSAKACLDWVLVRYGNLRCDTHPDNKAMRHVFESDGFARCGIIHVMNVTTTPSPRIAYQRHDC